MRSDPAADSRPLGGQLARVAVVGLDPGDPERVLGRVLAVVPGPRQGMPRARWDIPSYPSLPEPARRQLAPRPAEVPHEL